MPKKFIFILSLLSLIFIAIPALSATDLLFTPLEIEVTEGESVTMVASIDPRGIKNYTVKLELEFPAELLEITSFRLSSNWLGLSQTGYDLIDNTEGLLIKTAGFPGGINMPKTFGVISFKAKNKGRGVIKTGAASFALDAKNQDILVGRPKVFVAVIEKIVPEKPIPEVEVKAFEIPEEIPKDYVFEKQLKFGNQNIDVAYLQICLREQGLYTKDITGYFGPLTKQAVIEFQERYSKDILAPAEFEKGTGLVSEATRAKLNDVCFVPLFDIEIAPEGIPEQLFDINLEIDEPLVANIQELTSRVVFISFGRAPTPVDLTFIILDELGRQVHTEKGYLVVETEVVFTKKFEELELSPGKYTLVLNTFYDIDVKDEFSQDFEIIEKPRPSIFKSLWFWLLIVVIPALVITIIQRKRILRGKNNE